MVARYGWKSKPSPRRGFTVVEASRETTAMPVVVAVHDSPHAARLFRNALDEAMGRHRDLVVLDYGKVSLHEILAEESAEIEARERRALKALSSNPHVRVIRIEPDQSDLEKTVSYCESTHAALLILAADHIGADTIDANLASRLFNGKFDLLIVAEDD